MIRFESGTVSLLLVFQFEELTPCRQIDGLDQSPGLYEVGGDALAFASQPRFVGVAQAHHDFGEASVGHGEGVDEGMDFAESIVS